MRQAYLSVVLAIFMSCQERPKADLVLNNGKIHTVNQFQPWAEAIASLDGNIVANGTNAELESYRGIGEETEVINLDNKLVLPGFIDTHSCLLGRTKFV